MTRNKRAIESAHPHCALYLIAIAILFFSSSTSSFAEEVIDSICAIVDNEIILESEVIYGINGLLLEQKLRYPTPEQLEQIRNQVMEAYITQKILLARAEEETLSVEDRVVDRELDKKYSTMLQQIGSEQQLSDYFGRPIRQIKRDLRKGVEDALLIEQVKGQQLASTYVRRQDVVDYYHEHIDELPNMPEQVEMSHILITVKSSDEARQQATERIEMIYDLLREGLDFDSVAHVHSDGPSAHDESQKFGGGGRLGWTSRNDLVPEYEEAAYQLDPGEISDVVESRYGFHIIRLIERQGEKISTQHILIQLEPTDNDAAYAKDLANQIYSRVKSGESFAELAQQYSDDTQSATNGGKLEPVVATELTSEFQDALVSLQPSELSPPFETPFGWHIIQLDDRISERKLSLTDDWQIVEQFATMMKREASFNEWVQSLKDDHYIWPKGL